MTDERHLEKCEFDGTCDFCDDPQNGTYANISNSQCGMETNYYVCGKCAGRQPISSDQLTAKGVEMDAALIAAINKTVGLHPKYVALEAENKRLREYVEHLESIIIQTKTPYTLPGPEMIATIKKLLTPKT